MCSSRISLVRIEFCENIHSVARCWISIEMWQPLSDIKYAVMRQCLYGCPVSLEKSVYVARRNISRVWVLRFQFFYLQHLYTLCTCNGYISISALLIKYIHNIRNIHTINIRHTDIVAKLFFNAVSFRNDNYMGIKFTQHIIRMRML